MPQRITVVGTGNIGATLARRFRDAGMLVTLASRDPGADIDGIPVRSIEDALDGADVVVTAIPGAAMPEFLEQHRQALAGIPLVDATNNMGGASLNNTAYADGLLYYRAFNTLGVENFAEPEFDGVAADLFYSGPESHAATVESLIEAVGLRPVWVGDGAQAADLLDGMTRLWFTLALQQGRGRHLAFRMLR